jgi:hypothetical protein
LPPQTSLRTLLLAIAMIAVGIQFNLYSRISLPSFPTLAGTSGDTWQNTKRSHGWPFEVFELSRQSLAHVVGKNGGNIWSIVYYSNQLKPIAVFFNFLAGAVAVFVCYTLFTGAEFAMIKYNYRDKAGTVPVGE